jgi:PAT family beta-lactamase induction signal transducer AmpG
VDRFRTKRFWIASLQLVCGALLGSVALAVPAPDFFRLTLAAFWLLAFSSATHDIAADGFYLLALPPPAQAAFVGVRSTFFRVAMIAGQGGLIWLVGRLEGLSGSLVQAWAWLFSIPAAFFVLASLYHLLALPKPAGDHAVRENSRLVADFFSVFAAFFRKERIATTLGFLLLYRFAEALVLPVVRLFLLDARTAGGLGLTNDQYSVIYGTVGVVALLLGGLLGGYAISRFGLRRMLWPMIIAMYLPNLAFIGLAATQTGNLPAIGATLAVEQFGYGFGFTAYLVYMMMIASGEHRTAHYAICTGFMALGLMLPGLPAGWLQQHLGYTGFFLGVCLATIPSFIATALIKPDPAYGRKD